MPSNKPRLYIAMYPSGVVNNEELKYHWAFLIGPKDESKEEVPGTRYHVKNSPWGWEYEAASLKDVRSTVNLLARISIAKIEDEKRLISILRQVPLDQGDPNWRCLTWVADALDAIAKDGRCVGTAELDWSKIEAFGRRYVRAKTEAGRFSHNADMLEPKPTWDMLEDKETVS
ncbi:hypothetical protein F4802DRAFT_600623 [Xylaria palmicola]|nr:hypothetical protein F4802DRAFT_600623 [Xylaria palmicola]